MTERLRAIEIAEGALVADLVVVFQVIWMFVPPLGIWLRLLIPVVCSILLLRQRFSIGILSTIVAVGIAGLLTGPNLIDLAYLCIECLCGLAIGRAMARQWHHGLILTLGTLIIGLGRYLILMPLILLLGVLSLMLRRASLLGTMSMQLLDQLAGLIGLGAWWQRTIDPLLTLLLGLTIQYWWLSLLLSCCLSAFPAILVIYTISTLAARRLGYAVRPFPDGRVRRALMQIMRWITALSRMRYGTP